LFAYIGGVVDKYYKILSNYWSFLIANEYIF